MKRTIKAHLEPQPKEIKRNDLVFAKIRNRLHPAKRERYLITGVVIKIAKNSNEVTVRVIRIEKKKSKHTKPVRLIEGDYLYGTKEFVVTTNEILQVFPNHNNS
jgi:hypothetical protein